MNSRNATILVASDSVIEARQVQDLLLEDFDQVMVSALPEHHVRDFEQHKPSMLVLAFRELERAESYYLGLYQRSRLAPALPHRTLVLCHKDEVRRCYELCRKEYFDDYALFWPVAYDRFRLPMSVLLALRAMEGRQAEAALTASYDGKIVRLPDRPPLLLADPAGKEMPRKTILIVDDDAFQCKLLGKLLADLDCELCFVMTGEEVLSWVSKTPPSLILVDIMLPGINGFEVTHQLKSNPALAQIPVIMITGNSDRLAVAKSLKAGAIDFVVKPFNREILRKKVEKFLD